MTRLDEHLISQPGGALDQGPVPVNAPLRFLSSATELAGRRSPSLLTGIAVHILAIAALLLAPLWFTEVLAHQELSGTALAAPPPPPPPAAAASAPRQPRASVRPKLEAAITLPTAIPRRVAVVSDAGADLASLSAASSFDGVAGGVPGGVPGGVVGGVLGGLGPAPPPPVQPPPPQGPVRVGGALKLPTLLSYAEPVYPPVAARARIGGVVCIDAVIDNSGRVVEAKILSGHPLLARAAIDAVARWRYEPTYLNGVPVPVAAVIRVAFNPRRHAAGAGDSFQTQRGDLCQQVSGG